jgi:hypothetical protein
MIVALQYYEGDLERTMSLARLLADVELRPRLDVLLALVCQPGTPETELVRRTVAHCRRVFPTILVTSEYGAVGHPEACTALWRGTASHFYKQARGSLEGHVFQDPLTKTWHTSLLTLDGGDGVPLHRDWIDLMIRAHVHHNTDKLITGTPYYLGTCPLHVNPNAIFELEVFSRTKLLTDVPKYDGTVLTNFDVYHREEMLRHASLSSIVRTDWRGGGEKATRELLLDRSRESVWLHGYKDPDLYWTSREHLLDHPAPPRIRYYDLEQLRVHEGVRRSFEGAQS